jgi:hypothetical protein
MAVFHFVCFADWETVPVVEYKSRIHDEYESCKLSEVMLEMLLERLSQKYSKLKRY